MNLSVLIIFSLSCLPPCASEGGGQTYDCLNPVSAYEQTDSVYLKRLQEIEELLNKEIPGNNFWSADAVPVNYFIFDLTDPKNTGKHMPDDNKDGFIRFTDGHFFHVIPVFEKFGYSFILYTKHGKIFKVFSRVNCNNSGNSLSDVLSFARLELSNDKHRKAILRRLKRYRDGIKFSKPMDNYGEGKPDCN